MAGRSEAILISSSPLARSVTTRTTKQLDTLAFSHKTDADDYDFDALLNFNGCEQLRTSKTITNASTHAIRRSSSPRLQEVSNGVSAANAFPKYRARTCIDDSSVDDIENLVPAEQSAKRRKLSPSVKQISRSSEDIIALSDLSSEPEIDALAPRTRSPAPTKISICHLDDEDESDLPDLPYMSSQLSHRPTTTEFVQPRRSNLVEIYSDRDRNLLTKDTVKTTYQAAATSKTSFALKDRAPLASLSQPRGVRSSRSAGTSASDTLSTIGFRQAKSMQPFKVRRDDFDDILDSSQAAVATSQPSASQTGKQLTRARRTSAEKEAKEDQKRLEKEARQAEKQREKEQKKIEKQLAADKAEVNKRKTDRKVTAREMIIEMPASMRNTSVANQVSLSMQAADADSHFYDESVDMTAGDPVQVQGTIIKWKRRIKSSYDEDNEEWMLLPSERIEREKHILVYLMAEEYCTIAAAGPNGQSWNNSGSQPSEDEMTKNMDTYITLLRSQYPGHGIVLLIEGLASFIKKIANTKNRQYQQSVRQQNVDEELTVAGPSAQPASSGRPSKKRKSDKPLIDLSFFTADIAETLEVHLQLEHQPLQIHHTTSTAATAKQIDAFTQHLSTRPYRLKELEHNLKYASFSMASGQVRTGQGDKKETWIKMLEQVNRITISLAHGVYNAGYESPAQLVNGFKQIELQVTGEGRGRGQSGDTETGMQGRERARLMLQDVKKAANNFGADSDKRLGPMVSKRLYKVFMSTDENMRDGIA